jgi:glycosyltransferase involved in cell wall biosynthesis
LPLQLRNEFDVWVESFTPPISSAFLPLFTSKPIVGLTQLLGGELMTKKYKLPFSFFENIALKYYSHFIAITPELKSQILKKNPHARVAIIPNGIVEKKHSINKKIKQRHILYLGRLDIYQKGIDLLLAAFKEHARTIKYPLVIAGNGSKKEVDLINKQINKLDLYSKVTLVGKVEGSKKEQLLEESVLTIVPSRFESFGIVVLEAFHFKSPVVCFDIAGFKWIKSSFITKVKPFDTKLLGQTIKRLATGKTNHKKTLAAYHFSKKFNWDATAEAYEKFLVSIVKA